MTANKVLLLRLCYMTDACFSPILPLFSSLLYLYFIVMMKGFRDKGNNLIAF